MTDDWLDRFREHLASGPRDLSPEQMAARIHEALVIAEAEKYATPKSRFVFRMEGTDEELAEVRNRLSPRENEFVRIERV
jgi:hypothetical protein